MEAKLPEFPQRPVPASRQPGTHRVGRGLRDEETPPCRGGPVRPRLRRRLEAGRQSRGWASFQRDLQHGHGRRRQRRRCRPSSMTRNAPRLRHQGLDWLRADLASLDQTPRIWPACVAPNRHGENEPLEARARPRLRPRPRGFGHAHGGRAERVYPAMGGRGGGVEKGEKNPTAASPEKAAANATAAMPEKAPNDTDADLLAAKSKEALNCI